MSRNERKMSKSFSILTVAFWSTLAMSAPAVLGQVKGQEMYTIKGSQNALNGRGIPSDHSMGVLSPASPDCSEVVTDYAAALRRYSLPPAWSLPPEQNFPCHRDSTPMGGPRGGFEIFL